MGYSRRGLRAELSAILDVDYYTLQDTRPESLPLTEPNSTHLSNLILASLSHKDEVRTIYEFLPILMLRIFGYESCHGWLETACELPGRDREALVRLIKPEGPLHVFCKSHSPARDAALDLSTDMRFVFLRSNLPAATNQALQEGPSLALKKTLKEGPSFLAPFLQRCMSDKTDDVIYLSPMDYFYVCLLASPTRKLSLSHGGVSTLRKFKRSSSLPSKRALYNQIVAAYASGLNGSSRVSSEDIFIPACLDFLFIPWACGTASSSLPPVSTAAAEAVASIMLALVPSKPSNLDLVVDFRPAGFPEYLDWKTQTNTSVVYRAAEAMLESVFRKYEASAQQSPLIVYLRILGLYIAPWKSSVRKALAVLLFPRKRTTAPLGNVRSAPIAAFASTLSSINAHLVHSTGSPGNASAVKESQWRSELRTRQKFVDVELLRLAIVKAANSRLPSLQEGGNVLSLVAEAAVAAKLCGHWDSVDKDLDVAEEIRSCLLALRNQKLDYERQTGRRVKNYINGLCSCMGIRLDGSGMLSGITDMVRVRGTGSSGVGHKGSGNGMEGGSRRRSVQEKHLSMFAGAGGDRTEVPFLGDVWDRPIVEGENEAVVLWLYGIALLLEPRIGYVPNLRFVGRYWIWFCGSIVICTAYVVKSFHN